MATVNFNEYNSQAVGGEIAQNITNAFGTANNFTVADLTMLATSIRSNGGVIVKSQVSGNKAYETLKGVDATALQNFFMRYDVKELKDLSSQNDLRVVRAIDTTTGSQAVFVSGVNPFTELAQDGLATTFQYGFMTEASAGFYNLMNDWRTQGINMNNVGLYGNSGGYQTIVGYAANNFGHPIKEVVGFGGYGFQLAVAIPNLPASAFVPDGFQSKEAYVTFANNIAVGRGLTNVGRMINFVDKDDTIIPQISYLQYGQRITIDDVNSSSDGILDDIGYLGDFIKAGTNHVGTHYAEVMADLGGQANISSISPTRNVNPGAAAIDSGSILTKLGLPRDPDAATSVNNYVVKSGENLWQIATERGIPPQDLIDANQQITHPGLVHEGQVINIPVSSQPIISTVTTTTTTTAPSILQSGAANEGSAAAAVNNGVAVGSSVKNVSFSNGELNSTSVFGTLTSSIATDGIRPGNFSVLINGISTPVPSLLVNNPAQSTNVTVANTNGGSNHTFDNYGVLIPSILNSNRTYVDPLILDLNNDGVQLTSYADKNVLFDIDNDGLDASGKTSLEQTGWVKANTTTGQANNMDGILVHDLNNNGKIDGIRETLSEFYNGAAGSNGIKGETKYTDGFDALRSLDTGTGTLGSAGYKDNIFDSKDATFTQLRVWVDANVDGITDAGELKTLAELGISAINLNAITQSGLVNGGNEILASGTFTQSGVTKQAQAINFVANTAGSSFTNVTGGVVINSQAGETGQTTSTYSHTATTGATLNAATLNVRNIYGGNGNDTITGDANINWLGGGAGADSISAGAGDDVLLIDANDISIDGGDGNDIAQVIGDTGVTLNLAQSHIEAAVGGRGNDILIGGGRNSVFITANDGDDIVIGGAANDVLSGENGNDLVDGGAGNDLIRGGRGRDQLLGGSGDDILDGGQDDDIINGGDGNDVLTGGQGDDAIEGGDGIDIAEFNGSFADYRITRLSANHYRVVDTRTGRDGADTLSDIEKLSFADVSFVDITLDNPIPVKDIINIANRTGTKLIKVTDLLANDRDFQGDELYITTISDIKGGSIVGTYDSATQEWTPTLTANGEIQFTPNPAFKGVISFKYKIADSDNTPGVRLVLDGTVGSVEARGQVFLTTPDMPADTLFTEQWYLDSINILPVWNDGSGQGYTGKGVRIGMYEPDGDFAVSREIFDTSHPDLAPNVDASFLVNEYERPPEVFSSHATAVAGLMVAARNGEGVVGVAYNAKLAGYSLGTEEYFSNSGHVPDYSQFDVVNNSWQSENYFALDFYLNDATQTKFTDVITDAINYGRNGLGTIMVFASGNERGEGWNANYQLTGNLRSVINVGAINGEGDLSTLDIQADPFSNPGASILISAPGANINSTQRLLLSENGTVFGNEDQAIQGTSFAAPLVSGVVALMLEANPNLGYRDVQEILALSARKVDATGSDWVDNKARNWNGGGMHVSHDYGFGNLDALAAVRLAETWSKQQVLANELMTRVDKTNLNAVIPDVGTLTTTFNMATGIVIEQVELALDLDHARWGDLVVKLISPTGTESILMNRPGKAPGSAASDLGELTSGNLRFSFGSTHDWGESSAGTWTVKIIDAAAGATGNLKNATLALYGRPDDGYDTYVYTNEFGTLGTGTRATLIDTNGGIDTINIAAVSGNNTINLNAGSTTSSIAGKMLTIGATTSIEHVTTGDGDDTLIGNASSNRLLGGRGNDSLNGATGLDFLDGGKGNDTLTGGSGSLDLFVFRKEANAQDTITDFTPSQAGEKLLLLGFSNIQDFSQISKTQLGADLKLTLGDGQSILVKNLTASQLTEQQVTFLPTEDALETYLSYMNNAIAVATTGNNVNLPLPTTAGDLTYFGLEGDDQAGANTVNDLLDGGNGNDFLYGEYTQLWSGNDWLEGGAGNDTLVGGPGNDMLFGGSGDDGLDGEWDDDYMDGGSGDDIVKGEDGNDVIIGGAGRDLLRGGAGSDSIYLDGDAGEIVISGNTASVNFGIMGESDGDIFIATAAGKGVQGITKTTGANGTSVTASNFISDFDSYDSAEKIDLSALKNLRSYADLTLTEFLVGNSPITQVRAGNGADAVYITLFNVAAAYINSSHFILPDSVSPYGSVTDGNDSLVGNAGGNLLNGSLGSDIMEGRTGGDNYIIDNVGDVVVELAGGGYDAVQSSVTYTLAENVEQLTLTGATAINATGNNDANRIVGNSGNNILDGKGGSDDLRGGAGNDTYIVDAGSDRVAENTNEGIDTVQSSVSWTLGSNLENLTLIGVNNTNATGNELVNTLVGNAADNILDGALGADSMTGGSGNDTYYVDNVGDTISELVGGGYDTVYSSINISTLNTTSAAQVEQLVLTIGATQGTGNALDNVLIGNDVANTLSGLDGADYLDGGLAADTMIGGLGNDTYNIDNAGDVITETSTLITEIDTVQSSLNYTLGANLENLTLTGTSAINGTGNSLANVLTGNSAINTLTGGLGNDTYVVNNTGDIVSETSTLATEIDTVQSSATYTLSTNVENLTLTGSSAINATGNTLANIITGNAGNNTLNGSAGIDTLIGGFGDDIYVVDTTTDVITELANSGIDTIESSVTFSIANISNIENITLTGTATINATGNALDNVLKGNSAINTLTGGLGNDTYVVDNTGDIISETSTLITEIDNVQSSVSYSLSANLENLTLTGSSSINAIGNASANLLTGNSGNNTLDGGAGIDTMVGGLGNDTYNVDNLGDRVVETSTIESEFDMVQSSVSYILGANIENLTLIGSAAISGTGNTMSNNLVGNSVNNTLNGGLGYDILNGGGGIDTLIGGIGNDIYIVDTTTDIITEAAGQGIDTIQSSVTFSMATIANVENLTLTGSAAINATGNSLNNVLTGNSAINTLAGGLGNDTYIVDSTTDIISEAASAGTDTVQSSVTFTLASIANVENLNLTGTAAINATGNALDNVLTGNSAINTLAGGLGNDTYVVDSAADIISEAASAGTDTVESSVTYSIASLANVENLTLSIYAANINGTGNALSNTLTGNYYNNILDGGAGIDTLNGGYGDDTYIVDTTTDVIIEGAEYGIDTVQSSVTFSLAGIANVENLTLTGTAAINATGNAQDNILTGNSAINTLAGGLGNDTYVVNSTTDIISESANAGTDTVQSSVTFSVASIANVENITLTGTAAINATGNSLGNILTGNSAINTLTGGTGNDTYVIDTGDIILETSNIATEIDTVESNISYTLGANLENLTLTGATAITGTGNNLNNILKGNSIANTLTGGLGNDTYISGIDSYIGSIDYGSGISAPSGHEDIIIENDSTVGNIDTLQLMVNTTEQYSSFGFVRDNNDLVIKSSSYDSGTDEYVFYENIRIKNQFLGTQYQIENIVFGAGTQPALTLASVLATYGYDYNATSGNDLVIGDANTRTINGLAGDDSITGSARNDFLNGGDGIDTILGAAGNDWLNGGVGNDILNGGIGNDSLYGEEGEDVYEFGRGYGIDTAYDNASEKSTIKLIGIASTDANLRFERILLNPTSSSSTVNTLALKITLLDTGEILTFNNWWDPSSDNTNKFIQLTDVRLNLTDLENRLSIIAATSGMDFVMGTSRADNINGGLGNDRIYGFEGDDILDAGVDGYDMLFGGLGNDQLFGNDGDTLDGGEGADIMTGTSNSTTYYVDNVGDQVNGLGVIYSRLANYTMQTNSSNLVRVDEGTTGNVTGNALDNFIIGNNQSNLIQGLAGNDTLSLNATAGNDILQGGSGNDSLRGYVNYGEVLPSGSRVWDGGAGDDTVESWSFYGSGNDILIGGLGNDSLLAGLYSPAGTDNEGSPYDESYIGSGNDIIAFNKGDGNDRLVSANGSLTVSLGKLTNYSDLSLTKVANDLVLKVGSTDSLTFADWYKSSPVTNLKTVQNLQVIAEAMTGFNLGGADALRNNKIENFNFANMVSAFDTAGATANWQLTDALLTSHLNAGSDTAAMGGDLAYQYGKNSNLTGMGLNNAQSVISSANFGQYAQAMNDPTVWQAELVKLG